MLRLSTKRLRIYLALEGISLVSVSGVFKKNVLQRQFIPNDIDPSPHAVSWQATLKTLAQALLQPEWSGLKTSFFISSAFLRLGIAMHHDDLTRDEQIALLQHQFEELYGQEVAGAQIYISHSGFRNNELACTIDANFLEALHQLFSDRPRQLISIQPWLVSIMNAYRDQFQLPCWFVVLERRRIHFARISSRGWESIRVRYSEAPALELEMLLEREMLQADRQEANLPVYIFWPDKPEIVIGVRDAIFLPISTSINSSTIFDGAESGLMREFA